MYLGSQRATSGYYNAHMPKWEQMEASCTANGLTIRMAPGAGDAPHQQRQPQRRATLARQLLESGILNGIQVSVIPLQVPATRGKVSAERVKVKSRPASAAGQLETGERLRGIASAKLRHEATSFEDIACLADCHSLTEISLDGNPFQQDPNYKKTVVRHMQQLRQFDMKRISDEEKRTSALMARKEDEKKRQEGKMQIMKDRRRLAINNAKRQWEVMQGGLMTRSSRVLKNAMPELYASHVATLSATTPTDVGMEEDDRTVSSRSSSRPASAKSVTSERDMSRTTSQTTSRNNSASSRGTNDPIPGPGVGQPGGSLNHLSELEGDTLSLYGAGALDAFDRSWGLQAAGAVTTVIFKFIEFDEITKQLHKIRVRFPNVHTLVFTSTNICSLQQLNALSAVRRLDNLTVDDEANPVTQYQLWKTYVLFRLAHFNLKKINDVEVSAGDIVTAEKIFGTLSHMTTSQLPQSRLLALLGDSKRKHLLDDKKKPASSEGRLTDRGTESVGRAGLVYSPPDTHKESRGNKEFVRNYVKELANVAIDCDRKQATLQQLWPQLLHDMARTAVVEMWDMASYSRKCLEELEKS